MTQCIKAHLLPLSSFSLAWVHSSYISSVIHCIDVDTACSGKGHIPFSIEKFCVSRGHILVLDASLLSAPHLSAVLFLSNTIASPHWAWNCCY